MPNHTPVVVEVADAIAWIKLNRPSVRNAMDRAMGLDLAATVKDLVSRPDVRCLALTGIDDTAFCAGADIQRLKEEGGGDTAMAALEFMRGTMHEIVRGLYRATVPTIAFVAGPAVGAGMSLALACDILVAHANARFSQAFVRMGIIPDLGALHTLTQRIGLHRAKELMLTGKTLGPAEAQSFGIVNEVVGEADWARRRQEWTTELAALPPYPVAAIKRALHAGIQHDLESTLEYEAATQTLLRGTADHQEAIRAFFEKRKPLFGKK